MICGFIPIPYILSLISWKEHEQKSRKPLKWLYGSFCLFSLLFVFYFYHTALKTPAFFKLVQDKKVDLFPRLVDLKEYRLLVWNPHSNCWQHRMKPQHFVSLWYTYLYTYNSSTHGYQKPCFVPSSEHSKWDLFNNPLHWYCRTSALRGRQQSQPHGKHSSE